jgi:1-deoxyxylulose-5-phosphate synthase
MEIRRMGNSGLAVSVVGLGCNNFGRAGTDTQQQEGTTAVVEAALDAGITFFDTANSYTRGVSEAQLGKALGGRRGEVVIATKFGMDAGPLDGPDWQDRGSRRYIMRSVEGSLRRLGTDHIDLLQFHKPDPQTPIEETLSALDALIASGKVRYVGHSNFAGWQIAHAHHVARELGKERFVSAQNHYSLLHRDIEREVLPAARRFGLGVIPYFPLASGLLTGKYSDGVAPAGARLGQERVDAADLEQLGRFGDFARERGVPEVQVAVSFLLAQQPVASVIAGATKPEQVRANAAAGDWRPSHDDLVALDEIFPRG